MSFYCTREVKASKRRRSCEECGFPILIGEPYRKYAQHFEGEFYSGDVHGDCQDWAGRVMCCDDGRGLLCDSDPADEFELEDNVKANPPSCVVFLRLPAQWKAAVRAILGSDFAGEAAS